MIGLEIDNQSNDSVVIVYLDLVYLERKKVKLFIGVYIMFCNHISDK